MDREHEGSSTSSEEARTRPRRRRQRTDGGHRSRMRDIGLGITCGLAALGIAAGAWIGGLHSHDTAEGAPDASGGTSMSGSDGRASSKTISVNVTTFGSLRSVIGGSATLVSVPDSSTVADLSERLADLYPELAPAAMLAIDDASEMMPLDRVLTDGQTVELIGSMAGG